MTLQIEEGRFYRTRDGEVKGPVEKNTSLYCDTHPWRIGDYSFLHNGRWGCDGDAELWHDLIAEVPAPVQQAAQAEPDLLTQAIEALREIVGDYPDFQRWHDVTRTDLRVSYGELRKARAVLAAYDAKGKV